MWDRLFLILLSGLFWASSSFGIEARIRVRLGENLRQLSFRGFDLEFRGFEPAKRWNARNRTEWRAECRASTVFLRGPDGVENQFQGPVAVISPAGFIHVRGHPIREEIRIHPHSKGCDWVNVLRLESYLEGVVNSEFSSQWNSEAVKAQIIASRSYALAVIRENEGQLKKYYDVESSVVDQVYGGFFKEDTIAARLVRETKGMTLVAADQRPIKSFYSSQCGGVTEAPGSVWGNRKGAWKEVECPYCQKSTKGQWEWKLSAEELRKKLVSNWRTLDEVLPFYRGRRLERVRLSGKNDKGPVSKTLSGVELRGQLGPNQMRSTLTQVIWSGDGLTFKGKGWGHGVGLCQWGAKYLGEKGLNAQKILSFYYPFAELKLLW